MTKPGIVPEWQGPGDWEAPGPEQVFFLLTSMSRLLRLPTARSGGPWADGRTACGSSVIRRGQGTRVAHLRLNTPRCVEETVTQCHIPCMSSLVTDVGARGRQLHLLVVSCRYFTRRKSLQQEPDVFSRLTASCPCSWRRVAPSSSFTSLSVFLFTLRGQCNQEPLHPLSHKPILSTAQYQSSVMVE